MRIQDFDISINLLSVLMWQDNEAPAFTELIRLKNQWYARNYSDFWQGWERDVFDLNTANDFGLSVWARILGVPMQVTLGPQDLNKPTFGFGSFNQNFGRGNFTRKSEATLSLSTEQQRTVLRMRYFQLVSRGTVPEINEFVGRVFSNLGPVYVLDGLDMTLTYVFGFAPDYNLAFLLENYDMLPRPSAVGVRYIVTTRPVFGFGNTNQNFNNGTFYTSRL